jgi:putative glycerol-1-phosphate prenyltransferase/phosphoglycerol geranylgeranyltransferase
MTETRIKTAIAEKGALLAVLLDPDTSEGSALARAGEFAQKGGADLLLVGASFLAAQNMGAQVRELKSAVDCPVVLFPGGASQVVPGFDAMLFMTLVSGRNPQYLIEEQVRGGMLAKTLGVETLPTAYMLINSGRATSVEFVSNTRPIPANKPKLTLAHAVASELMGMRWTYLEAGSGADSPVPVEHIMGVRKYTELGIFAGGGITTPELAAERARAGAHIVVTGTIWEKRQDAGLLAEFAGAVHR